MSNAEYVRALILECPDISKDSPDMMIDFLGDSPLHYSIEGEPTGQVIKRYLNGDTVRRFSFSLMARRNVIEDADRAANNENCERLSLWLEQQSRGRRLPAMDDGAVAQRIGAIGAPYLHERSDDGDTAIYLMQIELQYTQKARSLI